MVPEYRELEGTGGIAGRGLMCGIAGLCAVDSSRQDLELSVRRMTGRLVHRGPDEDGYFVADGVALGSRRLKVIDLVSGRMPISNERGTVQVVYNGEIYNYRALRADLQRRGHRFASRSDTEVLAHLYEEHGPDMVRQLRGMFAFALWDAESRTLLLGRDRVGIKPLFYRIQDGHLWFGSELKALIEGSPEEPEVDPAAVAEYLALGYIKAPRTIYRGFLKLLPGTLLRFQGGSAQLLPYWQVPAVDTRRVGTPEEALQLIETGLREAVRERLVADVPLGAFLSGGVDSSIVVALAAQESGGRLKTFTVGFPEDRELHYARRVSEIYHTDHHELILGPESCRIADDLLAFFDEPFGDASSVPTYYVSQLARRDVTVVLSGDGGDELFGGYDQYIYDARWAWLDTIPRPLRQLMLGVPGALLPPGFYGVNRLRALAATREGRFSLYRTQELDARRGGVLRPDLLAGVAGREEFFAEEFAAGASLPVAARLLYVDQRTYLPDDILAKVDRMSMAHSLEARVPLLDHRLVELAARIPMDWKVRGGAGKWVLKELARRYLPPELVDRPKRGFSLPIGDWLRGPLGGRLERLIDPQNAAMRYLYPPAVQRLVNEHRRERRNHPGILWRLVMLDSWLQSRVVSQTAEIHPIAAGVR